MSKKSLILAICLIFIVLFSSSNIFAEDTSDISNIDYEILEVQEDTNEYLSEENSIDNGADSETIQNKINSLNDGDTLTFAEGGSYSDICIYINKSITINGNGATIKGYDNPANNIPSIIKAPTTEGGFAITNTAIIYILNHANVTIKGLTIVSGSNNTAAGSALIYAKNADNLTINGNVLDGGNTGIYLDQVCNDGTIINNQVKNQASVGIFNFGSGKTLIKNNTVTNAVYHGIDVRHGSSTNVQVINNTVIDSKEGIYLMHSSGHNVTENNLITCSISSITCYGSSNIQVNNNKLYKSRIGILLASGYANITVGENTFNLDSLPFPPTFVYYIAEGKSTYQGSENSMGTYSDITVNGEPYVEYSEIKVPELRVINYSEKLSESGNVKYVTSGMTNSQIQALINEMNDGDTLSFEANAKFENISLYTEKNIKIIGNNATLIGYESIDLKYVAERIKNTTTNGGYANSYRAVLYSMNNTDVVISNLNIIARYPGYNTATVTVTTDEYKTAGIYAKGSLNIMIINCTVNGASWGIFIDADQTNRNDGCDNAVIANNKVSNQYTTGIMNYGGKNALIANNTVTNAYNHGIDVRFGIARNAVVYNNTIIGAKEGIHLMHSGGHYVYNNTILNSKISSITVFGSFNDKIFNNTMIGSKIGILLGGNTNTTTYYNVTIGENTYSLDAKQVANRPNFALYIVQTSSEYFDNVGPNGGKNTPGIYSEVKENNENNNDNNNNSNTTTQPSKISTSLTAPAVTATYNVNKNLVITLKDANGNVLANKQVTLKVGTITKTLTTDNNGQVSVNVATLVPKTYSATISFDGDDTYVQSTVKANIVVKKATPKLTAKKKTFKAKTKTKKYTITLKSNTGKKLNNIKVTLKVKGKLYKATVKKGKATFKITKLTKKGKYTAKIKVSGNNYYKAISKNVKITVKK